MPTPLFRHRLLSWTRPSKAKAETQAGTPFNAVNDLAARWIASLPDKATVFSPVGVWPVLAILADAAADDVKADLEEALCFKASKNRDLVDAALTCLDFLNQNDLLDAAVAVWVAESLGVKEERLARLPKTSRGLLTKTAVGQVALDKWVQERTRNLFTSFPATVRESDDLVLASAVALIMRWQDEFGVWDGRLLRYGRGLDVIRTAEGITTVRNRGIRIQRSWKPTPVVDCFLVIAEKGAPAAEVLSRGHALVRQYGDKPMTYEEALKMSGPGLTSKAVDKHPDADNEKPSITISTPGFKVTANHDLLDNNVFGLKRASNETLEPAKHFPGISDSPRWVDSAVQSAVARFHSQGFSAAAITAITDCGAAPPRPGKALLLDINIDRSFGFLCVEPESKVVTFAGWVTEEEFMDNEDDVPCDRNVQM